MLKNVRRLVAGALTFALVSVPLLSTGVVAEEEAFDWESYLDWTDDEIPSVFGNGILPMDQEVIDAHKRPLLELEGVSTYSLEVPYPSSIDLSTYEAFPPIRSQGDVSSCAAFAAVYYQYTYAVNAMNGTSAKILTNQYSPSWPYYAMTSDTQDSGSSISEMYDFLENHGAMKWTQDLYSDTFQPSMPWPTNADHMREALNTRLYHWNAIEISSEGTVITSNQDVDLDEIKAALNYGKLIAVGTPWADDPYSNDALNYYHNKTRDPDAEKTIYYRCGNYAGGEEVGGHALTIVGYDDNLTYDINNNGTIEAGERGAFKIANSHGTVFGDDGFFWLMYDALNGVSSVPGDWDDQSTRVAAFNHLSPSSTGMGDDSVYNNVLTYIYVEHKTPLFLAEINLGPHSRDLLELHLSNKKTNSSLNEGTILYPSQTYVTTSNRTLIYDYEEIITSFDYNRSSMYWAVEFNDQGGINDIDEVVLSIKLTDNKGNNMETFERDAIESSTYITVYSCELDLEYGDVNYSGTLTSADVSSIMDYVAGNITYSNAQLALADYNRDGRVNLTDAVALNNAIS